MIKIFVVAISFGAALAVFPAAAQTGYGVKKNDPSRSPSTAVGITRTKARIGHEPAGLGCAVTMPVSSGSNGYFILPAASRLDGEPGRMKCYASLLALAMILLAAPACAGSRLSGFHRGGFPAFHPSGGLVLGFFGSYFCGYNCGLGFYNPAYGYAYGSFITALAMATAI